MQLAEAVREMNETQRIAVHRQPAVADVADVGGAVRAALEQPFRYPALRRALTPDDQVAIVVDETLPQLPILLTAVLEHLALAHIASEAVTLVCLDAAQAASWLEQLPGPFQHLKVEQHDPHNRKKLAYLATTKNGRRVYLNRTAVDADQLVVLSRRGFDPLLGHGGAEGAIFPALSDAETQQTGDAHLSMAVPGSEVWPVRQEAAEIAWLLGAPFFLQIIEGSGNAVAHVVAGFIDSSAEGQRLLETRWRVEMDEAADVVVAEVDGERLTFAELARAAACASRAVKPDGRIIVVCDALPDLGPAGELLRQADTPDDALALLKKRQPLDRAAAFQWAEAARRAKLFLLSRLSSDVTEGLFATPLENWDQVRRLVGEGRCLNLAQANKTLAVVR